MSNGDQMPTWGSWSRKKISTGSLVVYSLLRTQSCASDHLENWTYFWTKIHNLAMKEMLNVQRSNRWSLKQTKGDGSSIFLSEMPGTLCSNESASRYPPTTCCRNDWESVTSLVVYGNCDWVTGTSFRAEHQLLLMHVAVFDSSDLSGWVWRTYSYSNVFYTFLIFATPNLSSFLQH